MAFPNTTEIEGIPFFERLVMSRKLVPPRLKIFACSGRLAPELSTKLMQGNSFSPAISFNRMAFCSVAKSIEPLLFVPTLEITITNLPETIPIPPTEVPPVPKPFPPNPANGSNSKNGLS